MILIDVEDWPKIFNSNFPNLFFVVCGCITDDASQTIDASRTIDPYNKWWYQGNEMQDFELLEKKVSEYRWKLILAMEQILELSLKKIVKHRYFEPLIWTINVNKCSF